MRDDFDDRLCSAWDLKPARIERPLELQQQVHFVCGTPSAEAICQGCPRRDILRTRTAVEVGARRTWAAGPVFT